MAKTTEKKKRKNIVQRMMFGNENKPDLTPEQMNMSKWAMFKYLFFHRFGTLVALNLLTCIFAIPGIAVMLLFYLNSTVNQGFIPYSSNFGVGYPVIVDAARQGTVLAFMYRVMEYLVLVPCIAVLALGIAGNLYVMRKLIWDEQTSTVKDFFRGIKKCWLAAVLMGVAIGFTLVLFIFSLDYFDTYNYSVAAKAICITLATILLVFISLFGAFLLTQNAAYKMRPMVLIRNSALFVFGTHILALIFVAIAVAPAFLAIIDGTTMIVGMLYLFFGFSFATLVITLFCHYCYEKFLYDKIDKPSAVYAKRGNDIREQAEEQAQSRTKKRAPVPYKNPKKRKKSIDEGSTITPLAPTFRREDLERLEKEHEQVLRESESLDIDDELGELEDLPELENTSETDE